MEGNRSNKSGLELMIVAGWVSTGELIVPFSLALCVLKFP